MKRTFALIPGALIIAAVTTIVAAERPPRATAPTATHRIELAPDDADERGLEKYLGAPITRANGETAGEIHDFLADGKSSRLEFAVVGRGALLGVDETLRLVPAGALRWSGEDAGFAVALNGQQWRELLTISEEDFEQHRIAVTGPERARGEPAQSASTAPSGSPVAGAADLDQRLIRVSELSGKNVQVGDTELGEIEDVILDFGAGTVRVVLDPNREMTGVGEKVLVPLGKFLFAHHGERLVGTTLTRSDFNDLDPSWNQTTGPRQPGWVADRHREERGLPPLRDPNPVDR